MQFFISEVVFFSCVHPVMVSTLSAMNTPEGIAVSRNGAFALVSSIAGHRVWLVDLSTTQVRALAGSGNAGSADGEGTLASFDAPECLAISADDSFAVLADGHPGSRNSLIRRIEVSTGAVTTLAGNASAGSQDGIGTLATFRNPRSIALSPDGSYALINDFSNFRVRRLDMTSMAVTTLAGSTQGFADGFGSDARFNEMFGIAIDSAGLFALICDYGSHLIRRLDIATNQVTTLAGSSAGNQDGAGTNAHFIDPHGISIDPTGTQVLIVEHSGRIRRIAIASAQVTTLAGAGSATQAAVNGAGAQAIFWSPTSIAADVNWTFALVADRGNNLIRRIALSSPPCSAGFYCPAGSSSAKQVSCMAGTFCPLGSANRTVCPRGSYCPAPLQANYTQCPAGSFCNATGLTAFTQCALGSYCPSPLSQIACPAGFSCNATGLVDVAAAIPCLPMSFSLAGSSACASCEINAYSHGGASTCVSCGACTGIFD
jgi:DNA-binding beta-propeller fold protein YncE